MCALIDLNISASGFPPVLSYIFIVFIDRFLSVPFPQRCERPAYGENVQILLSCPNKMYSCF